MCTRWRRGTTAAVLLVVLAGVGACSDGNNRADPTTTPSRAVSSTSAGPSCTPTVTSSGYLNRGNGIVFYGLLVDNPCDQASITNVFRVVLVDATGTELTTKDEDNGSTLPVILPHQQLATSATITTTTNLDKATGIKAEVTHNDLVPPSLFANWPKTVTVRNVAFGTSDQAGTTDLTFDIVTAPSTARLCNPVAEVLIRDKAGKILYGYSSHVVNPPSVRMTVVLPPGADKSLTVISIAQGDLSLLGTSQIACQGE
jgi:hypothetical protein